MGGAKGIAALILESYTRVYQRTNPFCVYNVTRTPRVCATSKRTFRSTNSLGRCPRWNIARNSFNILKAPSFCWQLWKNDFECAQNAHNYSGRWSPRLTLLAKSTLTPSRLNFSRIDTDNSSVCLLGYRLTRQACEKEIALRGYQKISVRIAYTIEEVNKVMRQLRTPPLHIYYSRGSYLRTHSNYSMHKCLFYGCIMYPRSSRDTHSN